MPTIAIKIDCNNNETPLDEVEFAVQKALSTIGAQYTVFDSSYSETTDFDWEAFLDTSVMSA